MAKSKAAGKLVVSEKDALDAPEKKSKGSKPNAALVTVADVDHLARLPQAANAEGGQRSDLVGLMASGDTLAAIKSHAGFFEAADLDLSNALESAESVADLVGLRTRLANALALVDRNIAQNAKPLINAATPMKRLIEGTPEGSRIRTAFDDFLTGWSKAFPGGRGEREKADDAAPEPAAPKKG